MFEFANRPPQGPEDVSLSESGRTLLESATGWDQVEALGRAACTEFVDSFGEAGPPRNAAGEIVLSESYLALITASDILAGSDMNAFVTGINHMRLDLTRTAEVPA